MARPSQPGIGPKERKTGIVGRRRRGPSTPRLSGESEPVLCRQLCQWFSLPFLPCQPDGPGERASSASRKLRFGMASLENLYPFTLFIFPTAHVIIT